MHRTLPFLFIFRFDVAAASVLTAAVLDRLHAVEDARQLPTIVCVSFVLRNIASRNEALPTVEADAGKHAIARHHGSRR